ncbi:arabinose 5-phosphate isomerase [Parvularcula bermudensis HTCC2503]|uniref:Arabinose 5-phosphate isomerase n=1 Tax=Parvularcula bermudensis (strain ATCC BAA-594 / HTCC2503 / KCTC 12087) TaxID=314260 RepID=E0TBE7_PARBH|nr:KpsF/GutQ family sugar-phosphate isomerase [Parvularcula bermudensis]ADM09744.1 arabinose 5-phosphate isomerase [Parvularcula bermudensis HTCC2503]
MPTNVSASDTIATGRAVLTTEANALHTLGEQLDDAFAAAVRHLTATSGFTVVTGVGKSGHIGRKMAATFASTGTPSFFVHPTEASHGDLGMLDPKGVLIAISNSGETRELRDILLYANRRHVPLIAMTARPDSFLAKRAEVTLLLPRTPEACPNGLAPTSSTTMTLALGDALAVAAMTARGFSKEDFGARHPGGRLGMQLQRIEEYLGLQAGRTIPTLPSAAPLTDVLQKISEGRVGAVAVVDAAGLLEGIVTDGDVRRGIMGYTDVQSLTAADLMSRSPITIAPHQRVSSAVEIFETRAISQILVIAEGQPIGVVHIKDLMADGYL